MKPDEALAALSGQLPYDYTDADNQLKELGRARERAWHRVEQELRGPWGEVKKYIRRRVKLGKYQRITFQGNGLRIAFHAAKADGHVPFVRMTVHAGVSGMEISCNWSPQSLAELDRLIGALNDALAAIRME
jgi:hypothetical protein